VAIRQTPAEPDYVFLKTGQDRERLIDLVFQQGPALLHQPAKNVGGRVAGVLERPQDGGLLRLGFLRCEKRVALTGRVFFSASKHLSMLQDRRAEFNAFLADVGGRAAG
jgi:hypothetical protein